MNIETFIKDYKNIKKQDIIEELYDKCKANRDYYVEITRLNNIINELEKWLEDEQKETILSKRDFSEDRIDIQVYNSRIYALNDCIDKLKELKEKK